MPRCRHSSGRSWTNSSARRSAEIKMEQGSASFPRSRGSMCDPWQEVTNLARMPSATAIVRLTELIEALPHAPTSRVRGAAQATQGRRSKGRYFLRVAQRRQGVPPESSRWQWRRRRPLSLEYIPSLGATPRSCSFPCFGCAGRRLRPWHGGWRLLERPLEPPLGPNAPAATMEGTRAMRANVGRSGLRILAWERKPL
jgi:hypothetical protein